MTAQSDSQVFAREMLDFIGRSPTPFHAVANMEESLAAAGFEPLSMAGEWQLRAGRGYYCTRNDSTLVAFVLGEEALWESGLRLVGAHTDSPCLRLKPRPVLRRHGYYQLGVEVYGGALLNPWFDRDLSLAGRVTYLDEQDRLCSSLVDFRRPVAVIPSLAIHLDREANSNRSVNPQNDMPPLLALADASGDKDFNQVLLERLAEEVPGARPKRLMDFELSLYDTQPPAPVGLNSEFLASARLDNLASCYTGLRALLESRGKRSAMLICNDHEEVGSQSAAGAQGPFLRDILSRLVPDAGQRARMLERSLLISADNAHGIHPNFPDRHDDNHGPLLNAGPVIKLNANQRYATTSEGSALFQQCCDTADVPVQHFVNRSDMACGSTIGPLTASALGLRTLDVGIPTFAMHSVRELAGSDDAHALYRTFRVFQEREQVFVERR